MPLRHHGARGTAAAALGVGLYFLRFRLKASVAQRLGATFFLQPVTETQAAQQCRQEGSAAASGSRAIYSRVAQAAGKPLGVFR
jgi:hypothetical protein